MNLANVLAVVGAVIASNVMVYNGKWLIAIHMILTVILLQLVIIALRLRSPENPPPERNA